MMRAIARSDWTAMLTRLDVSVLSISEESFGKNKKAFLEGSAIRIMGRAGRMTGERPFVIGLTGNIATGKSEVARFLARFGARVIDADKVAHEVMRPGGPAYKAVLQAFGRGILAADGTVDRPTLGAIVFRDSEALRRLENAVHPAAQARVDELIAQATEPVVVVEAIKLIEAGMHHRCDDLWVVTSPRSLQIRRLTEQRGMSEADAALRVDAQLPQQQKAALADRLFVNDDGLDELEKKVRQAWREIVPL